MSAALTLALLTSGCSREARAPSVAPLPATQPKPPPLAAAPALPDRPPGADGVDSALTEVQLFNASAAESLADIGRNQARLRSLAAKAADLAKRADAAPPAQRAALAKGFADTLAEREATHGALGASLEAFRTTLPQVSAVADSAAILCQPIPGAPTSAAGSPPTAAPGPETYAGCVALTKERETLAANIAALNKAFEAAEAAYGKDRGRLDEASATMALLR